MISVANRTETAARIKYAFDHKRIHIDELYAPDRTLHIDSKVLGEAESQDEARLYMADAMKRGMMLIRDRQKAIQKGFCRIPSPGS